MKRFANCHLSKLAVEALAGEEEHSSGHIADRMARAVGIYLSDQDSDQPGWAYPEFMRDREVVGEVELKLRIDRDLWRRFEEEAKRQRVSLQKLLEHAAFYAAAEVDAGRLTERILGEEETEGREGGAAA